MSFVFWNHVVRIVSGYWIEHRRVSDIITNTSKQSDTQISVNIYYNQNNNDKK